MIIDREVSTDIMLILIVLALFGNQKVKRTVLLARRPFTDNPITISSSTHRTQLLRRPAGRCSFAIDYLSSLTIQLPNCPKGPIKSILKTSTAYPSPSVDYQHHFSQQKPRSTAKENDEQESHEKAEKRLWDEDRTQ